jgi:8-amino-7-oxononanoate synthase
MGWRDRLVERGKQMAMTPRMLRVISDDRVMKAAEGVMDARGRMRAAVSKAGEAWHVLKNGHALPNIDPSIDEDDVVLPHTTNGAHSNGKAIETAAN